MTLEEQLTSEEYNVNASNSKHGFNNHLQETNRGQDAFRKRKLAYMGK